MECFICNVSRENPGFREKREEIKNFTKGIWDLCRLYLKIFFERFKAVIKKKIF